MEIEDPDSDKNTKYITTLMIFPIEFSRMRLFLIKQGDIKAQLFHMIRNLNFLEFGLLEITFRKCLLPTSV